MTFASLPLVHAVPSTPSQVVPSLIAATLMFAIRSCAALSLTYKTLTGEAAAHLFHAHVILTHGRGLPVSIFSDRDPRFVSAFFTEFFTLCGVKLSTTSGYRSTSNGLVEIHNQHLEQLLRENAFEPEKWLEKLPLAVRHQPYSALALALRSVSSWHCAQSTTSSSEAPPGEAAQEMAILIH